MKLTSPRSLAALVALNVALLAGLVVTLFTPEPAQAQFGGGTQYLMLAGQTRGQNDAALIYILDVRSAAMISVVYNSGSKDLEFVASRGMANDIQEAAGPAPRGR